MDEKLFLGFISNILGIRICSIHDSNEPLTRFEEECCFHHTLQPMYTVQSLAYLIDHTQRDYFYEITDYMDTNLILFQFNGTHFLAGPFVKNAFSEERIQQLLITHKLPASMLLPLKLYYYRFPSLSYTMVSNTILATMRTFRPSTPDFSYRKLQGFHEELKSEEIATESSKTYMQILRQYEMENFFLRKITEGDVAGVQLAFDNTTNAFYTTSDNSKISMYSNNSNGFAIVRTLARKAAEQGGCHVVKIDEITQESIQNASRARTTAQLEKIQRDMLIRLTQAVADAKGLQKYSPVIRNVISYLQLNYTHAISLSELAQTNHVSAEHLSRTFKKETGKTISEYIAKLRTEKAADLLKNSKLSISEIATYVGYLDSNYFVKVFKKRYGMTPSAYR